MKCPNCFNKTDFDIKDSGLSRRVRCDKCGYQGSESEFAEQKRL